LIAKGCSARSYQVFVEAFEIFIHRRFSLPNFGIVTHGGNNDTSKVLDFIRRGIGTTVAQKIGGESLEKRSNVETICILTVAIGVTWLTVARAEVWFDPYTPKDGTYIGGHYRSRPDRNPYNIYTGTPAASDPNRYLVQHQNRNNFASQNPTQYPLNPYEAR